MTADGSNYLSHAFALNLVTVVGDETSQPINAAEQRLRAIKASESTLLTTSIVKLLENTDGVHSRVLVMGDGAPHISGSSMFANVPLFMLTCAHY